MKKILLLCLVSQVLFSQNSIYLGKDTTFCDTFDTLRIGDNLSIQGSNLGMEYLWTCEYKVGSITYHANDLLDNTTIPNPIIKNRPLGNDWVKFVLTATQDSNTYKDSINIRISQFGYFLAYYTDYLVLGDSVLFNETMIGQGISPLSFVEWKPSIGVRNPNSLTTYCIQTLSSSGSNLKYSAVVKDSVGCIAENFVYELRYLNPSSTTKELVVIKNIYVKDNYLHFDNDLNEEVEFSLFDVSGQLIISGNTKAKAIELSNTTKQFIICRLNYKQTKRIETQKIIVK